MAETKTSASMVFFATIKDCIEMLPLSDSEKLAYLYGVIDYGLYDKLPQFENQIFNALFMAIKPNIDANNRKKQRAIMNSENGKKGGRPKKAVNTCKSKRNDETKTISKSELKTIDVDVDDEVDVDKDFDKDCVCMNRNTQTHEKSIEERNKDFYNSLTPYVQRYGAEKIQRFYEYWKEPAQGGKRMRFELEKTWHLEYRLERWE